MTNSDHFARKGFLLHSLPVDGVGVVEGKAA
ncbi:hypothetical protein BM590_A1249 [Brucella melitensis M5-90]|nr:hypothetical protein BM590_A1249 [Brucella melitensis M5-90]